jgi:O-antigen biosynthesis protein
MCSDVATVDLAAAYRRARVAVVPLRFGAGVKLKVVEALREGLPLVTTPVGAQGLPGLSQLVMVEDQPQCFARAVLLLLQDDAEWEWRSRLQIGFARSRFSREAMAASLLGALGVGRRATASGEHGARVASSSGNATPNTMNRTSRLERIEKP